MACKTRAHAHDLLFDCGSRFAWLGLRGTADRFAHGEDRQCGTALPDRWSRTSSDFVAWVRGNFADVATNHSFTRGEVYCNRAGSSWDRRLVDSSGQDRHEILGEPDPRARSLVRHREGESGRPRYWIDGGVRVCDAVPGGNGEARGDGCVSSRRARMGSDLQCSEYVAFSFQRRIPGSLGKRTGAHLLRIFLER